jgi:hypothetical protein
VRGIAWRAALFQAGAILAGALALAWPALANG